MEFVKEFATFLYQKGIIKFGDFTLASGKKSSYYVDLRLVPSYPLEFRKMVKYLENEISQDIGLDNFESIVSVPTGGLVIASALAIETVKPLIYVRSKPKDYGTSKSVEGKIHEGIIDFSIGHPSETMSSTKILESNSIKDVGQHKTIVMSTGKDASNDNLGNSFASLWNCSNAIKKDGLAILVAECKGGLGSDALQQYIEDRLTLEQLRK